MKVTVEQTRAALFALHSRAPSEVIADLRAVAAVLTRELERLTDPPIPTALQTVETSAEGIRRLLSQLRISTRLSHGSTRAAWPSVGRDMGRTHSP